MHTTTLHATLLLGALLALGVAAQDQRRPTSPIPDTGQERCFDARGPIADPTPGEPWFGQDAQFEGNLPAFRDNGDGTVTDLVTSLMWQKTPDFERRNLAESRTYADRLILGGHADWRLPTIKELFSIADFRGNMHTRTPYVDTTVFDFEYPIPSREQRDMDGQYRSCTVYVGTTMRGERSAFGFNFADGRIKSYPLDGPRAGHQYVRCVRGPRYGQNDFHDNGDGTVTDRATGLTWQQADAGRTMDWRAALAHADELELAGHDDWRLPTVKELQSIVDYTRAPDARDPDARGPAIDPVFALSEVESWFWTSTTHVETRGAYYVCFGQGLSAWEWQGRPMNAHGAGAVRSDPKTGDPSVWAEGHGPQGDEVRILNHVRCVRGGAARLRKQRTTVAAEPQTGPPGRPGQGPGDGPPGFVARLDRDGDGKVSRDEFDGPARHFDHLDRDGDGYLDEDEAPPHPPPGRGPPSPR